MNIFQLINNKNLKLNDLGSILRYRAINDPEKEAFTFLSDGKNITRTITYSELDRLAKLIAIALQRIAVVGDRVLLLYTPGPEYIAALFGCLYSGIIAVPVYVSNPARRDKDISQLIMVARDAKIKAILTDSFSNNLVEKLIEEMPELGRDYFIYTDNLSCVLTDWVNPNLIKENVALLQYTSGSTNNPKGVILSHYNLLTNIKAIIDYFSIGHQSRGVIWLPPYHDMGLIGGILTPIVGGFPVTLMSPLSFMHDPLTWLKAISDYRGTVSGGPNFAYDFCVKRMKRRPYEGLDLSSWEVAFCGAEPINPNTIENFIQTFSPYGLRKEAFQTCYGLAEGSLIVTTSLASISKKSKVLNFSSIDHERYSPVLIENNNEATHKQKNLNRLVSCGVVISGHELKIVDPVRLINLPSENIGEIWVHGPSVSNGYWNKKKETLETFNAILCQNELDNKWLRTGDLGFLYENELFVTGRIKDLIIVRGRNFYPHDIELTARTSHTMFDHSSSVAFSVMRDKETEEAIVIQELPRSYRQEQLSEAMISLKNSILEKHDLLISKIILVKTGTIPKTSSGKVKRIACKEMYLNNDLDIITSGMNKVNFSQNHPGNPYFEQSFAINQAHDLSVYLERTINRIFGVENVNVTEVTRLTELGIDSLGLVELKHTFEQELKVEIDLMFFLKDPTINEIILQILDKKREGDIQCLSSYSQNCSQLPLTHAQRALLFLHKINPLSTAQTITRAIKISGQLKVDALIGSLEKIIERHPSLRSTFGTIESEPVQNFYENILPMTIQVRDVQLLDGNQLQHELITEAYKPFNLEKGPLIRFIVYCCSENKFILLLSAHHIILDFWSFSILFEELFNLYVANGSDRQLIDVKLPKVVHPSVHFDWYSKYLNSEKFKRDWEFWKDRLCEPLPSLKFKYRTELTESTKASAGRYSFQMSKKIREKVENFSQRHQVTSYITMVSVFHALLHRLSNHDDIIVGSPVATRNWPGGDKMIGYCVNTLPLRVNFSNNPSFSKLVKQVKEIVHAALEHQNFPFSLMVERLKINRRTDYTAIFNTIFIYQQTNSILFKDLSILAVSGQNANIPFDNLTLGLLPITPLDIQFKLIFSMTSSKEGFYCSMEYEKNFLNQEIIEALASEYVNLLENSLSMEGTSISQLPSIFSEKLSSCSIFNSREKKLNDQKNHDSKVYVAPRNAMEVQIVKIWEELSKNKPIGIYDNFFEIGGSSLMSVKLANQLSSSFQVNIDVSKIFELQTIADLSEYIQNNHAELVVNSIPIKVIPRIPYVTKE